MGLCPLILRDPELPCCFIPFFSPSIFPLPLFPFFLLPKAFCHYESQRLCGRSVLGSGTGGLSSYAMQVLLFALFNSSPFRIKHPLQALVLFFQTYASVPWSTVRITIYGVEPLYIPAGSRSVQGRYIHDAMLKPFRSRAERLSGSRDPSAVREFEIRSCNVEDPLLPWNNVARSVSRKVRGEPLFCFEPC